MTASLRREPAGLPGRVGLWHTRLGRGILRRWPEVRARGATTIDIAPAGSPKGRMAEENGRKNSGIGLSSVLRLPSVVPGISGKARLRPSRASEASSVKTESSTTPVRGFVKNGIGESPTSDRWSTTKGSEVVGDSSTAVAVDEAGCHDVKPVGANGKGVTPAGIGLEVGLNANSAATEGLAVFRLANAGASVSFMGELRSVLRT